MRAVLALCATTLLLACILGANCRDVTTTVGSLDVTISPTKLVYCCEEGGPFPQPVGQVRITNNGDRAVAWEFSLSFFLSARPYMGELAPG